MFNFLFKTGTYFFIWKKFKTQIISVFISIALIWLLFGIHNDLIKIFESKNTTILLYLVIGKWFIVALIIFYNILLIKSSKNNIEDEILENKETILPLKSQELLDKKNILSTTDLILKKYKDKI